MTNQLAVSSQRVQQFLHRKGFTFTVKELPGSTRTAQEAADSIGCAVGQIAKSLIFMDDGSKELVVVVASGANRVDTGKIARATGLHLVRADGKLVKQKVGFAIGGVPPVGHNQPLRTLLDPDLRRYPTIWAAAGTPPLSLPCPAKPCSRSPAASGWIWPLCKQTLNAR
jgi:prolyl-tRNA editing enzyme YbaK/EbsC (Cys-tRNA(Pro) deacylase)